jgi:hypothetical protein
VLRDEVDLWAGKGQYALQVREKKGTFAHLLTVLVRNDGSFRSPRVGTEDDTRVVEATDDGGTGRGGGRETEGLEGEGAVAEGVFERETGRRGGESRHGRDLRREDDERVRSEQGGEEGARGRKRGR